MNFNTLSPTSVQAFSPKTDAFIDHADDQAVGGFSDEFAAAMEKRSLASAQADRSAEANRAEEKAIEKKRAQRRPEASEDDQPEADAKEVLQNLPPEQLVAMAGFAATTLAAHQAETISDEALQQKSVLTSLNAAQALTEAAQGAAALSQAQTLAAQAALKGEAGAQADAALQGLTEQQKLQIQAQAQASLEQQAQAALLAQADAQSAQAALLKPQDAVTAPAAESGAIEATAAQVALTAEQLTQALLQNQQGEKALTAEAAAALQAQQAQLGAEGLQTIAAATQQADAVAAAQQSAAGVQQALQERAQLSEAAAQVQALAKPDAAAIQTQPALSSLQQQQAARSPERATDVAAKPHTTGTSKGESHAPSLAETAHLNLSVNDVVAGIAKQDKTAAQEGQAFTPAPSLADEIQKAQADGLNSGLDSTSASSNASSALNLGNSAVAGFQANLSGVMDKAPTVLNVHPRNLSLAEGPVQVEVLKLTEEGGGHAVVNVSKPDETQLRIDLRLDGQGQAHLVVEGVSDAARARLEQSADDLRQELAKLGLNLNLDMRQGQGEGQQNPAQTFAGTEETVRGMNIANVNTRSPGVQEIARRTRVNPQGSAGVDFYA